MLTTGARPNRDSNPGLWDCQSSMFPLSYPVISEQELNKRSQMHYPLTHWFLLRSSYMVKAAFCLFDQFTVLTVLVYHGAPQMGQYRGLKKGYAFCLD